MILQVENLSKYFGGIKAVDNISFAIKENELSSIIGPNGAGKSTLFNVITGHSKADSGRVIFKDEDITKLPPYEICRKGIGKSFQLLNLFQRLTIYTNIQTAILASRGLTLKFLKPAKNMVRDEAEQLLEDVGLIEKAYRVVNEVSYGEQRRLEVGIALAINPSIIFLDEPTAGLSIEDTKAMMSLIQRISKERKTAIIVIEHKMNVVFSISEKIRVLYEGKLIFEGTPEEVRRSKEVQSIYLGEKDGIT